MAKVDSSRVKRDVPIDKLVPYDKNARTHSDSQVQQIASSIREFGFVNPILVDEKYRILAGHGRLQAAKTLEMHEVPVLVIEGLTEAQKRAYTLADNKIADNAGWDLDTLKGELQALNLDGFPLQVIGFELDELADLLIEKTPGLVDEDTVPEPPDDPVTVSGDVWLLGRHRLVCGDSTVATDVEKCLGGVSPHLMVTDPPYGVEYDANWRNETDRANGKPIGERAIGKVQNDSKADWREAYALFPGNICYVWHADRCAGMVWDSLVACGFVIRNQIIWAKSNFAISRGDYHSMHEPCFYAVRGKGDWKGDRKQTTLWQIDKPQKSETGHSTQKPVECMRRPIMNNSSPGQAVYEPFSGSGTTIIAAEQTGRQCLAIELSPKYVDVAIMRWQQFTGQAAKREADGVAFNALLEQKKALKAA